MPTPNAKRNPIQHLEDWFFGQIHTKNLVYNTCWEDPRCDRRLLDLQSDSQMVMITSAGCNALDYVLDKPEHIHCIDMNSRQNALLELKLAAFANGSHETLFRLFGNGQDPDYQQLYQKELRNRLPVFAQEYWDKNISYFDGKGARNSFYYHGTSGWLAWSATKLIRTSKSLQEQIEWLFSAESLEQQTQIYNQIESKILNPIVGWILNRHLTMSLAGVPRSQRLMVKEKYERGVWDYVSECLRQVFTQLPIHDNYFWRVYLKGNYAADCCPEYLKKANFASLQSRASTVSTYTTTISQFLKDHPAAYSHYVLLNHQDWLAANNQPALIEEWQLILQNSRPGTKILLRSASAVNDFIPAFVKDQVDFSSEEAVLEHQKDRVGTYANVWLGVVKDN